MDRGWLKLWRKSRDSEVFKDSSLWHVWSWCLLETAYCGKTVAVKTGRGKTLVSLQPGQFVYGRNSAAKELNMAPSTFNRKIDFLRRGGRVTLNPDTHYTTGTIVNWETYQGNSAESGQPSGHPTDTQRTPKLCKVASGAELQASKNIKKEKNNITQQAEAIYSAYPRKADRKNTLKSISRILKAGAPSETLLRAVQNYKLHIQRKGTDREYVIQSNNFFGRAARWEEWQDRDPAEPGEERPAGRAYQPFKGDV